MRYRNPPRAKASSAGSVHDENREFLRLLLVVIGLVVGVMFVLDRAAEWLAPRVPFSWEAEFADTLHLDSFAPDADAVDDEDARRITLALQKRVDHIAKVLDVPAEISLTARYVDSSTVNAFATLGGHITVFRGLLDQIEYEEELDAVLAHEIGHVTHRHMVRQLSRGLSTAFALGMLGIRSATLNRWLIGDAQKLEQLAYSRAAEREADQSAQTASYRLYGHTGGLVRLFHRFQEIQDKEGESMGKMLPFLQSHPFPEERARSAADASQDRSVPLTPISSVFRPHSAAKVADPFLN